jgi:type III restriction enzyme
VEFTATPETTHSPDQGYFASNVLHHVSAAELKAEEMIKLPIKLKTRSEWKEVVGEAVETQRKLEAAATAEERESGEYLRPIVLFQAQPRSQERQNLTVEVVKRTLIDDFKIPENQIAVATGETREIDDVNLFDRECPIRFIITVQALKEGWDCSFAYVLCSVAEIGSTRAVEQILGRVLRLPRARWKKHAELNCAYAFAASQRFLEAANALKDALIENGFQRMEASDFVVPQEQPTLTFEPGSLFFQASEPVTETPSLSRLEPSLQSRVSFDADTGRLSVSGVLSESETRQLQSCFERDENRAAVQRLFQRGHGRVPEAAVPREPFRVPCLAIRVDGQLELFEENHFLDAVWNLAQCDAALSESEFPSYYAAGSAGQIDVTAPGRVEMTEYVEQLHENLQQLYPEPGWTIPRLANWLDRQVPHRDIPQAQSSLFIANVLMGLMQARSVTVEQLARQKYRLRNAVEAKIDQHRKAQAKRSFDRLLFDGANQDVEVSPEVCFQYDENRYAPGWYYEGGFQFNRHYFPRIGDLHSEGEEFECATVIDGLPQVKFWVRNLERRPESAFWLQTSTDKFYPDFVAVLNDGRVLVVECKGEHLWSNDDSIEKRKVGELWADRSNGRCLFVMPKGQDWNAITSIITPHANPPACVVPD